MLPRTLLNGRNLDKPTYGQPKCQQTENLTDRNVDRCKRSQSETLTLHNIEQM